MSLIPDLFRFNMLAHPWILTLLAGVAALFVAEVFARPGGVMRISTGTALSRIRGRTRASRRHIPALLRALGLALLVVAMARPLQGFEARSDRANVIDIMLCVDVSGSMRALDFVADGERRDRLYVTKEAVRHFLNSRKDRASDRFGLDRIGLVLYATYARTQCPLTLDYGILERELERADIDVNDQSKQKTAIGSALGLAVNRLRKSEAKAKVIILLTDGVNNSGELDPITAAKLAKDYGIKVYTIGAGGSEETMIPQNDPIFGQTLMPARIPIDEDTLKKISETTNGRFYRATDTESLVNAYDEINQLETTEVEIGDYYEYAEGFAPYAVAGALLLLASVITRRLWFEPIP